MNNIGFIGAGNMGGAMIHAIAKQSDQKVYMYDTNPKSKDLFQEENVYVCKDIKEVLESVDYIVLTVKPQYYKEVLTTLKKDLKENHVIITVAPGYSIAKVKSTVGEAAKVIRTMPNTPALVGKGITAYTYIQEEVEEKVVQVFLSYFESFGKCVQIQESQMEAAVAITGSSPAYGYLFIEAMADAAVRFGIPRNQAYEMSALAISGACEMVLQTGKCPGELKDAVTSPGGTTIEAVIKLEEQGFRNSVIAAMTACYDKAKAMNTQE